MIVEVSARKLSVPHACVCCSGPADAEFRAAYTRTTGKRVVRHDTRSWTFPCCQRCGAHARTWSSAAGAAIWSVVIGGVAGVAVGLAVPVLGMLIFIASLPTALVMSSKRRTAARAACLPQCATPGPAVAYLGWDGSIQSFSFASRGFAAEFARSNRRSLINVSPELRQLVESEPIRVMVPAPAPAPPALPARTAPPMVPARPASEHERALEWIAKIEGYKGSVARANALRHALQELADPGARQEVIVAAAKIEVAAVLDKVDSLAGVPAKRRHLEKAIATLRSDDVPDELQAEEIRELEQRLREL